MGNGGWCDAGVVCVQASFQPGLADDEEVDGVGAGGEVAGQHVRAHRQRRKLNLKASYFSFKLLVPGAFNVDFIGDNLLKLKAKFESSFSSSSFKGLDPGAFNTRFIGSSCAAPPSGSGPSAALPPAFVASKHRAFVSQPAHRQGGGTRLGEFEPG